MKTSIIFACGILVLALASCGLCQVTFSKGWGPGKRASDGYEYNQLDLKLLASECRALLNEVRQMMVCQRAIDHYYQFQDPMTHRQINTSGRFQQVI